MRPMRTLCPLLLAAVVVATATPALAEVDPAVMEALKSLKASDYPNANAVVLLESQSVVYQADGTQTTDVHEVSAALTPTGKDHIGSTAINFARDAEKVDIRLARVIKPDGTVLPVSEENITETELSGHANIYDPNGRSMKVVFAGVDVGDAVEVQYRLTRHKPVRDGFFADVFVFQTGNPMLRAIYEVDGPASLPLTSELYRKGRAGAIAQTKKRKGDRIHYRWSAHDVPQVVWEPSMNFTVEVPFLVVSTDPSWRDMSKWWWSVTKPQMEITDAIKKKVEELTKNAKTDEEKIRALNGFVAANIRYRGLGVGPRTGFTPRPADDTLSSRWGVCRDVAILLATMLRAAGVTAYPVLTNMGDQVRPKIAYFGFNHAIVAVPAAGGGWTYMDPTAKNSNDLLPTNEREQSALVCTERGEPLGIIPPAPPSANLGSMKARSVVDADGTLTSSIEFTTRGLLDLVFRSVAARFPATRQRQIVEQALTATLPSAEILELEVSNPMNLISPMVVTMKLRVPGAALEAGDYRLLRTIVTSGALSLAHHLLPSMLGSLAKRKYGLDANTTLRLEEEETIELPAGTKLLALPNSVDSDQEVSSVASSCKRGKAGKVTCHRLFELKSRYVKPEQYAKLKEALAAIVQVARQPIILGSARR